MKSHAEKLLFPADVASSPPSRLNHPGVVEVIDFMWGAHPGPTVDRFRIDVTSGPGSSWNLRACQVFAFDFCARNYPEASRKTHVDASYEFYRLLPSFLWLHAAAVGFEHPQRLERFHERFAEQARKYRVRFTPHLSTPPNAVVSSRKPAFKLQAWSQNFTTFCPLFVASPKKTP